MLLGCKHNKVNLKSLFKLFVKLIVMIDLVKKNLRFILVRKNSLNHFRLVFSLGKSKFAEKSKN
jgi:hypothetical protein